MSVGPCHLAVEPAAFIQDPSLFVERIKADRGVFLRRIDKGWAGRVHRALETDHRRRDFEAKRIRERALKLQKEHGVKPTARATEVGRFVDQNRWLDAARIEHAQQPCAFIVVESSNDVRLDVPIVTRREFEDLDVDASLTVVPTPAGLCGLLAPLLVGASWIVIEDPYLGAVGALRVLAKVMEAAANVPEKIVLTSQKSGTAVFLKKELSKHAPGVCVPAWVIAEAATNHSPGLHVRQVLTDRGGFVLDRGLDEFHGRGSTPAIGVPARLSSAACLEKRRSRLPREGDSGLENDRGWNFIHSDLSSDP